MNFYKTIVEGYISTYTKTNLTDTLHKKFDFIIDYQLVSKKIFKDK